MKRMFFVLILVTMVAVSSFITGGLKPSQKQKAALGKQLFFEKILSKDSSISCASCHNPQFAFADTVAFSLGINGKLTSRNTPSVLNMKNRPYYFWDGRAVSLQQQALIPLENPNEMDMPVEEAVRRLNKSAVYRKLFYKVFRQNPIKKTLPKLLQHLKKL
ncbi:MAG: cytochrome-c peroxidase [Chitinophagaceae bacterium]|nr:cytochrome-c peroxidase [Chitinophagaceae bacterium]